MEDLISKVLTNLYISHYDFFLSKYFERLWQDEEKNQKFKDFNSRLKILIYL